MEQSLADSTWDGQVDDTVSSLEEPATSEYNTAELSDLTGLSKILRADDSIVDRVRCLLEDDEDDTEPQKRPELLRGTNGNTSSTDEYKGKMASLLQDTAEADRSRSVTPVISGNIALKIDENLGSEITSDEQEAVGEEVQSPAIATSSRRSGDGADFVPSSVPQDSSDDIMNISDSTEYSDLPKVVDNHRMRGRSEITSASQPLLGDTKRASAEGVISRTLSDNSSMARTAGEARLYAESNPNTPQLTDDRQKLCDLEKYVLRKNQASNMKESESVMPDDASAGLIHSTPFMCASSSFNLNHEVSGILRFSTAGKSNGSDDSRRSQEGNITVRNRESCADVLSQSYKSQQYIPRDLGDDKVLEKVRKAVSDVGAKSSELTGPHTASEKSIASSVDSLALQVKNLLKLEERDSRQYSAAAADLSEVSHNSNYSEEITNFEKTSLWKYTRQFLPGAMTPSRQIQPLVKFSESSLIQAKDISSDYSNRSSPETYRLARQILSPNRSVSNDPTQISMITSNYSRESEKIVSSSSRRELSGSGNYACDSNLSSSPHQSYLSKEKNSTNEIPSKIVGRYDSYPRQSNYTPQNESYKPLEPEYSHTPYTPYTFVTPRKVAWEAEKDAPVVKYKCPIARERNPGLAPSKQTVVSQVSRPSTSRSAPVHERSAYFSQEPVTNVQMSPKLPERSPCVRFQRLTPDNTNSMKNRYIPQKDQFTSTKDHSLNASEDHIFVKPVTPPSRNQSARTEFSEHNRTVPKMSVVSGSVKSPRPVVHSNPKLVHSKESPSHLQSRTMPFKSSKSLVSPEYSFMTPVVSARPPQRNITPKVVKEKPRPSKSLPTFDQLVAEQEKTKETEPKKDLLPVSDRWKRDLEPTDKLGTPVAEGNFSALKPELYSEGSDAEEDVLKPQTKYDVRRNSSLSDNDLHRRTTWSGASFESDSGVLPASKTLSDAAAQECGLDGGLGGLEPPREVESFAGIASPPPSPAEPAPLPYVRLCKKKPSMPLKAKTPLEHSISTKKVQNLLMKEKSVGRKPARTQSAGVSASSRVINGSGYPSTDEELVRLLETFSTKVPLMEELLKKLYERHPENHTVLHPDGAVDDERSKVDQSVQTSAYVVAKSAKRRVLHSRKLFAESSCQTSFARQNKPRFANKITSPMEKYSSEADIESTEENIVVPKTTHIKGMCREDKENSLRKSKPCAFFVDLTPEKLPKDHDEEKVKLPPVAWYEPYEYMPPWKKRDDNPRTTLGFVDVNIQDVFLDKKRDFVLRSWERQEDIVIRAEERKLKELEERIHDQIVALHKEKAYNEAKSSANLAEPPKARSKGDRVFGWNEMRIASKEKYEALPEVVAKKREAERKKYYEHNRIRAQLYKRKVTRSVVYKRKRKFASEL